MLLHLTGPAVGARLAVCDPSCAAQAVRLLAGQVSRVSDGRPPPAGHCRRCIACGGIIDEPFLRPCLWHPAGCPPWQYTHTVAGALVAHHLRNSGQAVLAETTLALLEAALEASCDCTGQPRPAVAYTLLREWLLRPQR